MKLYDKQKHIVKVFVPGKLEDEYVFEGIKIERIQLKNFQSKLSVFNPDVLALHYPTYQIIHTLKNIKYPFVTWIHGHEAMWSFQLRSPKRKSDHLRKRIISIPRECYKMLKIRKFLVHARYKVFVSQWMKHEAEKHLHIKFQDAVIIPNPVDLKSFQYQSPLNVKKAISLRSFDNPKYGLDIAIKAFSCQEKIKLFLYGKGHLKRKLMRMIKKYHSNTEIIDTSLTHEKVPELYHQFGLFIAPSRIEAQGLAMCEAMACGLPIIATRVGGIPEFVRDGIDGYLVQPNDPKAIKEAVIKLITDEAKFFEMSKNARKNMETVCSGEIVIQKEIKILNEAIENYRNHGNTK